MCHDAESKYKCPVCAVRYCSVACFSSHKQTQSCIPAPAAPARAGAPPSRKRPAAALGGSGVAGGGGGAAVSEEQELDEDALKATLPEAALLRIGSSPELCRALRDGRLQKVCAHRAGGCAVKCLSCVLVLGEGGLNQGKGQGGS